MNMEARIRGIGMTSARTRARLVSRLSAAGIGNPRVLEAIQNTPRHMFVDEALASRAYEDCALPIGERQTISQPDVVARMTELLYEQTIARGQPLSRVLEIGSGSGYQAAVLSQLGCRVYTLERIRTLAHRASARMQMLGIRGVSVRYADGADGWRAEGPFDAVLITAALPDVPPELSEQLREGGVLVAPVGTDAGGQVLSVYRKTDGLLALHEAREAVKFVPFLPGVA